MSSPFRLNRLALRVSLPVAGTMAALGMVAAWLLRGHFGLAVLTGAAMGLLAGGTCYRAVHRRVARRLELARRTLREARKRRFEALARLPGAPERDELDALIVQVYRAGRALQQEIERLETVENYRREFLGDVSHELRTPIFAVSGFAETLLDGALDDERVRRRFVKKILSNARRLETLTRDLSAISKLESGELHIEMAPFELSNLAEDVLDSVEMVAREQKVTLDIHVSKALPRTRGDRDRIRQVLINLTENAIKYNEPGGTVEITARRLPEGPVRIAVVDDGIGIPKEAISRLTERFFRVDKSRSRQQGGTGLGLAIVKHILEAHGTRLSVESRLGYGSTFSFVLPAEIEG